jgi:catechol 2,3-dioxygenase-like lactoylglutathione lyase family enzyme
MPIERIDHVNLVVADMPGMIQFYRDVLGLRLARQVTISGPWIDAVTGLEKVEADVAFLELPDGPSIELLHYRTPAGRRPDGLGDSNTPGLRHIAFRVRDMESLAAAMNRAGAAMVSEIQRVPQMQVDFAAQQKRLVYCRDPEGNLLEFCEYLPNVDK